MTPTVPAELQPLAALIATVHRLEARVEELERARPVPAVIPLADFPEWYRVATGSPAWRKDENGRDIQVPVSEAQLRRWVARPKHFRVDWLVRDGRSLAVDAERWVAWRRTVGGLVRVREVAR